MRLSAETGLIRNLPCWLAGGILVSGSSEGSNAIGMYAVGSYWYVSVAYVVIAAVGIALTLSSPELRTAARP